MICRRNGQSPLCTYGAIGIRTVPQDRMKQIYWRARRLYHCCQLCREIVHCLQLGNRYSCKTHRSLLFGVWHVAVPVFSTSFLFAVVFHENWLFYLPLVSTKSQNMEIFLSCSAQPDCLVFNALFSLRLCCVPRNKCYHKYFFPMS